MKVIYLLGAWLLLDVSAASKQVLLSRNRPWTIGQPVHTTSGKVYGSSGTIVPDISAYLGIPFAKPPVANLRFAPPLAFKGHSTINATKFGASCPISSNFGRLTYNPNANLTTMGEYVVDGIQQLGDTFSEDCLTINIWTRPQSGETKKAVLVWIYGGGFTSGSSSQNDPQHIVDEEDVVVVSFNYRTNIFGFPGNPHTTNNLGFLDQRIAIEWVRSNIAAFAGDTSLITLFGQSAGAASIDFYSYAWTDDPIISGLILESGTTGLGAFPKNETAASWYKVTSSLNCGSATSDPSEVLKCMRTRNLTEITAAIPAQGGAGGSASFWPTVDDAVVFSDYHTRSTTGRFIHVPLLIGNTDYEGGFFATMAAIAGYPMPQSFWKEFTDSGFDCPASNRANVSVRAGLPTWRYRYFGNFPDLRLTTVPDSGAYHASELAVLFGSLPPEMNGIPPPTDDEVQIGKYMRGAWAAFAKNPLNGLQEYGWPRYNPLGKTLARLAYMNRTGTNVEYPSMYDLSCQSTYPT